MFFTKCNDPIAILGVNVIVPEILPVPFVTRVTEYRFGLLADVGHAPGFRVSCPRDYTRMFQDAFDARRRSDRASLCPHSASSLPLPIPVQALCFDVTRHEKFAPNEALRRCARDQVLKYSQYCKQLNAKLQAP